MQELQTEKLSPHVASGPLSPPQKQQETDFISLQENDFVSRNAKATKKQQPSNMPQPYVPNRNQFTNAKNKEEPEIQTKMKRITEATFEDSPRNSPTKEEYHQNSPSKVVVRTPSEAMVYLSGIPKVEPVKDECHNDGVFRDIVNLI